MSRFFCIFTHCCTRWNGPYKKRIEKDPWGNGYGYTFPGKHNKTYDLYYWGIDGKEGGEGNNKDITNW